MSPSTRRVLAAGFAAVVISTGYLFRIRGAMADFAVSYRASQRLEAGETLYQTADGHYMFKYLPASALLYLPLGQLPIELAKAAWFVISLVALVWSLVLVRSLVPLPHRPYLLTLSFFVLAKYFLHELRLGQINILVMLVMLLACRSLARPGRASEAAAGALAGAATALKPYAAVFVPYLLFRRSWAGAAAAAGVLAIALLVPAMFYGLQGNVRLLQEWAATLSQSTPALLTNNDDVSVIAFFTKWLGPSGGAFIGSIIGLAMLALLILAVMRRGADVRNSSVLECAMLLTLVPLISPIGWDYTFILSLLAVALLVNGFELFPRPARVLLALNFVLIALTLFDVMGRRAYTAFMQWSVTTVNFLAVVIALAYLRFRSEL
jgi:hypothetical protein